MPCFIYVVVSLAGITAPAFCNDVCATETAASTPQELPKTEEVASHKFSGQLLSQVFNSTYGGIERKTVFLSMLKLEFSGKLPGKYTYYIDNLTTRGGSPSAHTGDIQTISYIDAPHKNTFMEAWLEKETDHLGSSLRFGMFDLNAEFDCTVVGWLFINSSFGVGHELSQTGRNGPSIFPTSSLGLRYKKQFEHDLYLQTAILDGVPGDLEHISGTYIRLSKEEGALLIAEGGMHKGGKDDTDVPLFKASIGAWKYTSKFDHLSETDAAGNPVKLDTNQGMYFICAKRFWESKREPKRKCSGFLRYGFANQNINRTERFVSSGVYYKNLLNKNERIGLGIVKAYNGSVWKELMRNTSTPADDAEAAVEATLEFPIDARLTIQGDCQWIQHPGAQEKLMDAMAFGLNVVYTF
ncbi:MAG: carbohydrate porin [Candidatus Riflebacteria bacterium]|nr:carbohydrate porin [Candidatus Riflebacteria bacterium]